MGTKRAQVMAGPIKSTMKKTTSVKKTAAKKKGNFKNGKSFSEFMNTKTKRFGTY
jgi:hypothetical protein